MAVVISWTKEYSASDDGSAFGGADLGNIQSDIEGHSHTSGVDEFTNLSDTPANYTGEGSSICSVNASVNAIEFQTISELFDTVISSTEGEMLRRSASAWVTAPAGTIVQVVNTPFSAYKLITGNIPEDDTKPEKTEGEEIMTRAISPKSATNLLRIQAIVHMSINGAALAVIALFQDSDTEAIAVSPNTETTGNVVPTVFYIDYWMTAGTTSSTTFKIRGGHDTANCGVNGGQSARLYGGAIVSSLTVSEIRV